MNKDNHCEKENKLCSILKRVRPAIYYAHALWLKAESIHRLLSSCHCITLICQRRRTNEGFHKWSASENEKLHYALMKFLSKGPRRNFPFAWCRATGTHIYRGRLRLLAKKKSQAQGGACVGEMETLTRSSGVIKASADVRDALQLHTDLRLCRAVKFCFCDTQQRALKELPISVPPFLARKNV